MFLTTSAAIGTAAVVMPSRVFGAGERVQVGMMGVGGRGAAHIGWVKKSGGDVVAICDPDRKRMEGAAKRYKLQCPQYQDFRKMLEDKSIDAIVMATPNHWHAPGTFLACQAGKDVYCEKPASHSIWEGSRMVQAAREHDRIVQIGTQQRSDPALIKMREMLDKKELGEMQWIHALWYASRGQIGKVSGPTPIPDYVDYDVWCGPRPKTPLMRKKLHYDWHWVWDYGNGDMGNRVIHNIDDVHHVVRMNGDVPTRYMAVGGRFGYDDDANTPNTELIVMQWKVPIIATSRNLPLVHPKTGKKAGTSVYRRLGKSFRFTNIVKCEGGFFAVTRGGGKVYDNDGNTIKNLKGNGGGGHMKNFLDAVKSRRKEDLRAEAEQGHLGCIMLHAGQVSYRVGKASSTSDVDRAVGGIEEAEAAWKDTREHLERNGIDLGKSQPILGPWLTFDPKAERFTGENADAANALVKEEYRAEFGIPG
jgi:hypothetical protein